MREHLPIALVVVILLVVAYFLTEHQSSPNKLAQRVYEAVEIEGCEYIINQTPYGTSVLTHKGNCKNKIHIYGKD